MKNNNKNRKLNFIRRKNMLRLGLVEFRCAFKFSNKITDYQKMLDEFYKAADEALFKQYKLKLNKKGFRLGSNDDDFIKDTSSIIIYLSLK